MISTILWTIWAVISAIILIFGILCIVEHDEHYTCNIIGWMIVIGIVIINIIVYVIWRLVS